jgi:GT2 family glycosyltransferase
MGLKVSIIVLCYNGVDLTLECLKTLQQQDYSPLEILVVDNASQDGTADIVRRAFPGVEIICTGDNLGYAAGNNVGMQAALEHGADLVFLVNNDTRLEPGCVSTLVRSLENYPRTGVIGPMVYTWGNHTVISSAGGQINWRLADALNVGMNEVDSGQYLARPVDFINGCGLMVTRQAIEKAGMLDTRYFMYWEETDWCQRVKKAGFEIRFEPAACMEHKASLEVEELGATTIYYVTRNRLLFFGRHTPRLLKPLALSRALYGLIRGIVLFYRAGRRAHAKATQLGVLHALQRRWGRTDPSAWLNA